MVNLCQKAMAIADQEIGVKEVDGDGNCPRVLEYHQATDLKASSDSIPWCSAFVNWCFKQVGGEGTNDPMARSWLRWGKKVDAPVASDIVVFSRGNDGVSGHVGIVYETPSKLSPFIKVLGGNQDDMVCVKSYLRVSVLGYRRSLD